MPIVDRKPFALVGGSVVPTTVAESSACTQAVSKRSRHRFNRKLTQAISKKDEEFDETDAMHNVDDTTEDEEHAVCVREWIMPSRR